MFAGIEIIAVEPGTEIDHEGEQLTVTETSAVNLGTRMYMTEMQVAALKGHPSVKTEAL